MEISTPKMTLSCPTHKVDGRLDGAVRGGTDEKAAKHAERLFVLIDIDGDGNLTEKEFLRVCWDRLSWQVDMFE